ncbi:MAG TPA: queuosine salvage family protein [Ktedonobacteraceae bacterium]|nr:queuosine salvage family protein [Ktedonobacteraceae bacterium]
MADNPGLFNIEDEELYTPPCNDQLAVLSTTHIVVQQGENAWINVEQVERLCDLWLQEEKAGLAPPPSAWYEHYHFYDGTERSVNWILLLDALNFCFWAEKNQPRWTIEYHGEILNGYWAEAAALTRAVEEGLPLWDAQYLSTISSETVAHIFRGSQTIPLLEKRVEHVQEVGRVLLERYNGQFTRAIEQTGGNAAKLVLLLAHDFPSFYDVASYRNRTIRFFKRAQICVADLHSAFKGEQWGKFSDIDQLTAFADYKLPQVLRHYNVLEYHVALAERIDNQEILLSGSEEEVEIRAATVWACELLRRAMLQRGRAMTAAEIDQRLWLTGQNAGEMHPYHRTRTIYY